jgi:hypothetical protein
LTLTIEIKSPSSGAVRAAAMRSTVRCREIDETDLGEVTDLLARGFGLAAPRRHWVRALSRMGARDVPGGCPRFGYVLDDNGILVGVILTLFSAVEHRGTRSLRCGLAGWYVEPAFRGYAVRLHLAAMARKDATCISTTAAPRVRPILEAMGFRRYTSGQYFALPFLGGGEEGVTIRDVRIDETIPDDLAPDRKLITEHLGHGCRVVVCRAADGAHPFILRRYRRWGGRIPLPLVRLVHCRDVGELARFGSALGRHLLRRGILGITIDSNGPIEGLAGVYASRGLFAESPKFYRGADVPGLGDLADTELAIFGP